MTVDVYIRSVSEVQREAFAKLIDTVRKNIPESFEEVIQYKMPAYVVPHSIYPKGYHCAPQDPLPFISVAARKNFIALYHMGIYSHKPLYDWFVEEYPKHSVYKLDMGKSCIRFKKYDAIPYQLIAELMQKMPADEWIKLYEDALKDRKKQLTSSI